MYKDKDMERKQPAGALPFPTQPAVIFANWREVLNQASLPPRVRSGYALAIGGYLDYWRRNGLSVTNESARAYMADAERANTLGSRFDSRD